MEGVTEKYWPGSCRLGSTLNLLPFAGGQQDEAREESLKPGSAAEAARLLVAARSNGAIAGDLPENLRPSNVDEAYAIQDESLKLLGGNIGGWKVSVGKVPPVCAPVQAERVVAAPADIAPLHLERPAAEVEIAYRFEKDLPARATDYTEDEVGDAIGSVHAALEICRSRFGDPKAVSPSSVIADFQNCEAIVVGPAKRDWRSVDRNAVVAQVAVDGEVVDLPARAGKPHSEVMYSLAWLANHAAKRTGGLKKGDVVITGALLKVTDLAKGSRVEGTVASLAPVVAVL
jgi:2-keto-4-pentenoate hydratase